MALPRDAARAAQKIDEERRTHDGREDRDGNLALRGGARDGVDHEHEEGAHDHRGGQHEAVVRAEDHACGVGDEKAHPADEAAHRDDRGRDHGGGDDDACADPAHGYAEACGLVSRKGRHVEAPAQEPENEHAEEHHGRAREHA